MRKAKVFYFRNWKLSESLLFARNTLMPISLSLISLPVIIYYGGLSSWQAIVIGQGLGLLLAEYVDGGWSRVSPRIYSIIGIEIENCFRESIKERTRRFILALVIGLIIFFFTSQHFLVFTCLSFVTWLLSGISPLWMSIGTSKSKFMFRYWVFPRLFSLSVGIIILSFSRSILLFLLVQFFGTLIGPMILFTKKKKSTLNFSINNYSSKSDRDRIVMSNIANVASNWIIIFTLSLTIKLDASSLIAGYRYLDFAYAAACIFPQSQHGRLAKSKNQYLRRRSHQISFIITFIIITVSVLSFGLINQILFQNLIVLSHIQLLIIFSYLIVRIFLLLLTQDYLMNEGEDRIASNLNLIFAFASASSAFVASNILHNIDTLPLLNVILGILIITFMLMFSRYTRIMFREIFGWRL